MSAARTATVIRAVLVLLMLPALTAAMSDPTGPLDPVVHDFIYHCERDRGWCQDRVEAARMTAAVQGACIPEQLTPDRVTTAVVDWLKRNRIDSLGNEEGGSILLIAMKGEWPCGR